MSSILKTLLLLVLFLNSLHAHECAHGQTEVPIETIEDHHPISLFSNLAARNYANMRIAFDFSNLESASPALQAYIKENLIPPAKNYFEAALKVIPRATRIRVPSTYCGGRIIIPPNATDDGYEGDLLLFVSAVNDPSASYAAHSWVCAGDQTTKRPSIGVIEFNLPYLPLDNEDITFENELATTMHEIIHVLGFSASWYPKYIDPDTLRPLTDHLFNKTVNGVEIRVLNLPVLTEMLRDHFNCPTLEGAYMENQGGPGSFGSHFERRIFFNEIMTASDMKDRRMSAFTLALLEGTGWYQVNYEYAEPMTYGKNAGCAFLDTECINRETLEPNFKEFCSPLTSVGVAWTRRGVDYCGIDEYVADDNVISAFDYWGNKTIVWDRFADNCPQIQVYKWDCENRTRAKIALLDDYEFYGIGGFGFVGTLSLDEDPADELNDFCFKTQCKKKQGNYELQVLFGGGKEGDNVTCSAAGNIDASNFPFKNDLVGVLQCPDPDEFCNQVLSEGFCRGQCFGRGVCSYASSECICDEGWGSYNCAKKDFTDKCSRCVSDPLRTSCFGDDECVCNPSNTTCQCLLGLKTGKECSSGDDIIDSKFGAKEIIFTVCAVVVAIFVCYFVRMKRNARIIMEDSLTHPIVASSNDPL